MYVVILYICIEARGYSFGDDFMYIVQIGTVHNVLHGVIVLYNALVGLFCVVLTACAVHTVASSFCSGVIWHASSFLYTCMYMYM